MYIIYVLMTLYILYNMHYRCWSLWFWAWRSWISQTSFHPVNHQMVRTYTIPVLVLFIMNRTDVFLCVLSILLYVVCDSRTVTENNCSYERVTLTMACFIVSIKWIINAKNIQWFLCLDEATLSCLLNFQPENTHNFNNIRDKLIKWTLHCSFKLQNM